MRKMLLAASMLASMIAVPAMATEYRFNGSFLPAATALGGGSFDGTYTLTGNVFPTTGVGFFDSFTVNLRDSAGNILLTIAKGVNDGNGYINTASAPYYGGVPIYFYDQLGANYLQLIAPVGFDGMGEVSANGSSYALIAPSDWGTVGSGVIGVPEPAAWGLMLGGFGLLGGALRARRVRVAYA
jgi:hypothetical protein